MPASLTIFPPVNDLGLHVVSQLSRGAGKTLEADVLEFRLDVRAVDDLAQRAIELDHDFRRCARRRNETGPSIEIEALIPASSMVGKLGNSELRLMRDIAKARTVPAVTMRHDGGEVGEHHRHAAGDDILERRCRSLVGHMQNADFGPSLEGFHADDAGGIAAGICQLSGVFLGIVHSSWTESMGSCGSTTAST